MNFLSSFAGGMIIMAVGSGMINLLKNNQKSTNSGDFVSVEGSGVQTTINGKIYTGKSSVLIKNNEVWIDGIKQDKGYDSSNNYNHTYNVEVSGDRIDKINTVGRVTVTGNCGDINTTGRVEIGDSCRNVNTVGRVTAKSISGKVSTIGKVTVEN